MTAQSRKHTLGLSGEFLVAGELLRRGLHASVTYGNAKKAVKILGAIGGAVILLFLFVANFSSVESRFRCPGGISSTDGSYPVTVYLKLEEYRWWVGLWGESDAAIHVEIPNTYIDYFGNVKKVGDQYQIRDSAKNLKGNFSTLSNTLAIQLPVKLKTDFFDGTCNKIEK